jgi:hypothetical protein
MRGLVVSLGVVALMAAGCSRGLSDRTLSELLATNQFDIATDGRAFLATEIRQADVVLVGGLHGDNETPAMAELAKGAVRGPSVLVTEMSPWMANRTLGAKADENGVRVRGGDIEEMQLPAIIAEAANANPGNAALEKMAAAVQSGFDRNSAPELLALAREAGDVQGGAPGGVPLGTTLVRTLEVEADRAVGRPAASLRRERVMKDFVMEHYRQAAADGSKPQLIAVFGRNHMGRGIDQRGVSTLGNFLSEFAIANGGAAFHVAMFAAGGQINFGAVMNIDERGDDPAFKLLASSARYAATVFDLRPLRAPLHTVPPGSRSRMQASLVYWADAYDAIVCYRALTPMSAGPR